MEDKDLDECVEINITALKESGYELNDNDIEKLKKIIEHAKGLE